MIVRKCANGEHPPIKKDNPVLRLFILIYHSLGDDKLKFRGIDLTGKVYGRLTVVSISHKLGKKVYWECKCECGNITKVRSDCLKNGTVKSCKCLNNEAKVTIHGFAKTKLYHVWGSMKNRCNSKTSKHYLHYGARGIKVCEDWSKDYMNFHKWAYDNGYKEGLTVDRIDVNGNYEPSNCRLITQQKQLLNTRRNVFLEYKGESKTIKEWSDTFNIGYNLLYGRLNKYNFELEKALKSLEN